SQGAAEADFAGGGDAGPKWLSGLQGAEEQQRVQYDSRHFSDEQRFGERQVLGRAAGRRWIRDEAVYARRIIEGREAIRMSDLLNNEEFQLTPLSPDADTAELLEALGP